MTVLGMLFQNRTRNEMVQYNNVQCLPFFFGPHHDAAVNMARWLNYMTMTWFIWASHTDPGFFPGKRFWDVPYRTWL